MDERRVFKYRVWDTARRQFLDAVDLAFVCLTPSGDLCYWGQNEGWSPQTHLIASQFTGLKDKNGKEIYEGDIVTVRSQYETDEPIESNNEVMFRDGAFRCGFHDMILGEKVCTGSEGNWSMEVIGNIYENPELVN